MSHPQHIACERSVVQFISVTIMVICLKLVLLECRRATVSLKSTLVLQVWCKWSNLRLRKIKKWQMDICSGD